MEDTGFDTIFNNPNDLWDEDHMPDFSMNNFGGANRTGPSQQLPAHMQNTHTKDPGNITKHRSLSGNGGAIAVPSINKPTLNSQLYLQDPHELYAIASTLEDYRPYRNDYLYSDSSHQHLPTGSHRGSENQARSLFMSSGSVPFVNAQPNTRFRPQLTARQGRNSYPVPSYPNAHNMSLHQRTPYMNETFEGPFGPPVYDPTSGKTLMKDDLDRVNHPTPILKSHRLPEQLARKRLPWESFVDDDDDYFRDSMGQFARKRLPDNGNKDHYYGDEHNSQFSAHNKLYGDLEAMPSHRFQDDEPDISDSNGLSIEKRTEDFLDPPSLPTTKRRKTVPACSPPPEDDSSSNSSDTEADDESGELQTTDVVATDGDRHPGYGFGADTKHWCRYDEDGNFQVRKKQGDPWRNAVRHNDIRVELYNNANQNGRFDPPRAAGPETINMTSYHAFQKNWNLDLNKRSSWPKILFRFERDGWEGNPDLCEPKGDWMWEDKVVVDRDNRPLRVWPLLNDTCSSQFEAAAFEALCRYCPKLGPRDILGRTPDVPQVPKFGAFSARRARFRDHNGMISWSPRTGSDVMVDATRDAIGEWGRANNSTKRFVGFTNRQIEGIKAPNKELEASKKKSAAHQKRITALEAAGNVRKEVGSVTLRD